jgi:hypothetical protein
MGKPINLTYEYSKREVGVFENKTSCKMLELCEARQCGTCKIYIMWSVNVLSLFVYNAVP